MEDFKTIRNFVLQLTSEADLEVENTLGDLRLRISADDWSSISDLYSAGNFTDNTTILELLAAIQPTEDK